MFPEPDVLVSLRERNPVPPRAVAALLDEETLMARYADVRRRLDDRPGRDRRVRGSRSFALRGFAVAALVGAVAAALLLWPGTRGPSVLERARAAVAAGPVLHLALQDEPGATLVDLSTGKTTTLHGQIEIWFEPNVGIRTRRTFAGAVQSDVTQRVDRLSDHERALYGGFLTHYRDALESGSAKLVGEGTIGDRPVSWLQISSQSLPDVADGRDHVWAQQVAVTRDDGTPLYIRATRDGQEADGTGVSIVSFESLPRGAVSLQPTPVPPPTSISTGTEGTITAAQADARLGGHALSLGADFAGLPLAQIEGTHNAVGYDPRTGAWQRETRGARFFYGATNDGTPDYSSPYLALSETTEVMEGVEYGPVGYVPPSGKLLLQGPNRGILHTNGLYITVEASSPETLIAAAKAIAAQPRR